MWAVPSCEVIGGGKKCQRLASIGNRTLINLGCTGASVKPENVEKEEKEALLEGDKEVSSSGRAPKGYKGDPSDSQEVAFRRMQVHRTWTPLDSCGSTSLPTVKYQHPSTLPASPSIPSTSQIPEHCNDSKGKQQQQL